MRKRLPGLLLLFLLLGLTFTTAFAQTYLFRVPTADVNFYVNQDGTASIEYTYTFDNDPSASPIDFVDIGMPNEKYDLGSVSAEVDGKKITDIQKSQYVNPGIALGLGSNAIPPGQTGKVHVWIARVNGILYPSTNNNNPNYASFQFQPNYFDSKFAQGSTDLAVTLILPPGLQSTEGVYYNPQNWPGDQQPKSGFTSDNRIFYTWQTANADSSSKYIFGGGFPAKVVPANSIIKAPLITIPSEFWCCLVFGALIIGSIALAIWSARRRKLAYLPPKISMEGHGIKRGLTAIEAAVLMEQPIDKVLTMILFSVVKKGAAQVTSRDPLTVNVLPNPPQGMNQYELDFLKAFSTTDARARRTALQDVTVGLVKSVTEKMRGFSRKETVAYYQSIMTEAWQQVETAQTPEVKSQKFDENMDWTMLDKDYQGHTRNVFGSGPVFVPMWWGNWDPGYHGGGAAPSVRPASSGSSGGGGMSLPTLPGADFAASMVNGVQSFAGGVVGDVAAFTGRVTNVTNPPPPPPPPSTFRGGGGGGHSCACACACAGCACACAGGGR